MKYKKIIASIFIISTFFVSAFSLEIQKNNLRVFVGTGNDKFSNSISQNKDDQLTATTEIHAIFPYLFLDINLNSITNRGYKSKLTDSQTFTSGRYDELFIKRNNLNLFLVSNVEKIITNCNGAFCSNYNYNNNSRSLCFFKIEVPGTFADIFDSTQFNDDSF